MKKFLKGLAGILVSCITLSLIALAVIMFSKVTECVGYGAVARFIAALVVLAVSIVPVMYLGSKLVD